MNGSRTAGEDGRAEPEILGRLVRRPPAVKASAPCADVDAIFRGDPRCSSVLVRFRDGEAHLLPKRQFLEGITGAYGWAINNGRPVGRLVDLAGLTLPPGLGLSEASAAILGRDQRTRYDDVLVRTDRAVFGTVSVSDLLDRLAYLHADEARMAMRMAEAERRTASRLRSALEREHAANEHLRVLDELKTTFMQAVSHDLRTPLASVLGFAVTLERHHRSLPEEQVGELVQRLASNARRLDRIVVDLLDLDRLSRGVAEPHREPTDLAALTDRVVAEQDGLVGRAGGRRRRPRRARNAAPRGLPAVPAGPQRDAPLARVRHRARAGRPLRRAARRPRLGRGAGRRRRLLPGDAPLRVVDGPPRGGAAHGDRRLTQPVGRRGYAGGLERRAFGADATWRSPRSPTCNSGS